MEPEDLLPMFVQIAELLEDAFEDIDALTARVAELEARG